MSLSKVFSIFFLVLLFSCSNKINLKDEMILKPLPINITTSTEIAVDLVSYENSLNRLDYEEILSRFKNDSQKNDFKRQMIDFRIAYNTCVDKLIEVENALDNEKEKKITELRSLKNELDVIWKYIVHNFRI